MLYYKNDAYAISFGYKMFCIKAWVQIVRMNIALKVSENAKNEKREAELNVLEMKIEWKMKFKFQNNFNNFNENFSHGSIWEMRKIFKDCCYVNAIPLFLYLCYSHFLRWNFEVTMRMTWCGKKWAAYAS